MFDRFFSGNSSRIYYHAPDYEPPSWGIGMIYAHVELLREAGYDAQVVHRKAPFQLEWLDSDVPVTYLDGGFSPRRRDVLVIPEIEAKHQSLRRYKCRKFIFAQNVFLLTRKMQEVQRFDEMGYENALAIMPHVQHVIETHFGLQCALVSPFVAPYFFIRQENLHSRRRMKRIVVYPKVEGTSDYGIVWKMLERHLANNPEWQMVELKGYSHREVAEILKDAAFLVNVNTREAFNTSVAEALAAGCIAVCYEAYGGQDFLEDRENAYVFPNNHVYPLLEMLFELIDQYDRRHEELKRVREQGYQTALRYTRETTKRDLVRFYKESL